MVSRSKTRMQQQTLRQLALWSPRPNAPLREVISPQVTLFGLPGISLVPLVITQQQRQWLEQADAFFFISQHAVKQILAQVPKQLFADKVIIAIGEKTAKTLKENSLSVDIVAPPPFTSEALLAHSAFIEVDYQTLAIICGVGGRTLLQQTLMRLGKEVFRIPCYRRDMCDLSAKIMLKFLSEYSIAGVVVTSCRLADAVLTGLNTADKDVFNWPMFALSQRIGDYLYSLGFTQVIVADAANQYALNQTIITWWDSKVT